MKFPISVLFCVFAVVIGSTQSYGSEANEFSETDVCRAAISTIMGHPVSKIRMERVAQDGVIFLFYIRDEDHTVWHFKCFTEGKEVTWGTADGRWRLDPRDSKITFFASDEVLTITEDYGDGSIKKGNFTKSDLDKPYR